MAKICTDINQSEKLIELGIDVNTADMFYADLIVNNKHEYVMHPLESYGFKTFKTFKDANESQTSKFIPAWSLSALLGLMPTEYKKDEYYVVAESHSDYYIVSYRNCWDGCVHSEYSEESLLDVAFEMIVWLKENGKYER